MKYAFAPDPVFWSIQGEGHLRGFQMMFLRLAGCSIGCAQCDTDYSVASRMTAEEAAQRAYDALPVDEAGNVPADRWAWVTGGEPYDRDLTKLFESLRDKGFRIAVATSGKHACIAPVDWLSVSPHGGRLLQSYGHELKLVVGLNALDPFEWVKQHPETRFMYRYVQPVTRADGSEDPESLTRCLEFLAVNPSWALSRQDHVRWGVK